MADRGTRFTQLTNNSMVWNFTSVTQSITQQVLLSYSTMNKYKTLITATMNSNPKQFTGTKNLKPFLLLQRDANQLLACCITIAQHHIIVQID